MLSTTSVTDIRKAREIHRPEQGLIELVSVYLELKSQVEATWDNPDRDAYITDLQGDISGVRNPGQGDRRSGMKAITIPG